MKTEEYNSIIEKQLENIKTVLLKKKGEYMLDEDCLTVFKHAASMAKETPEQALYGFLLKHLVSQSDMIRTGNKYTKEIWYEKVTDIINYNLILLALLEDDKMFKE